MACKCPRQIHRSSVREPPHPNNTRPTRPRTFFLPVFAYPFSSESLEYATQLDAFSHAYKRYLVFFSFSRDSTLYAQSTSQGTLDVPGTLLKIAERFDKLEKWIVGHVRALEGRVNDVERWVVDKEAEKEKEKDKEKESESELPRHSSSTDNMKDEIYDL